jgi:type IV pilus assembly protein PilM
MVLNIILGEKRYLGIDLGSFSIKIVEVLDKGKNLEVVNFGIIPIINFKQIYSVSKILEESLASVLKEFLTSFNIKSKEAIFSLPTPYLLSSSFFVPNIPERSLPQVIKFETQKQIPLSLEEVEIEYRYFDFEKEGQKNWLVFLTAVPKTYFQKIENIAKLSKLNVKGYGVEFFNLEPFFVLNRGTFFAVDLGHSYSNLFVIKEDKTIYATKLSVRGYDYLDMVMNITKFTEEKTVEFVQKKGFSFNPEERELKNLSDSFMDNLVKTIEIEVQKTEDKLLLKPEKLYLTGGLSALNGFKEKFSQRFNKYPFEILDITEFVSGDKFKMLKEKSTLFTQALGVVFRKIMS